MYFMYCNVYEFTMPVVSGGTYVGLMYKFLSTQLRIMQLLTLRCMDTCQLGAAHPTSCPALQV